MDRYQFAVDQSKRFCALTGADRGLVHNYFYNLAGTYDLAPRVRMTNEQFAMAKALQWLTLTGHKSLGEFDRSFTYFLNLAKQYGTFQ